MSIELAIVLILAFVMIYMFLINVYSILFRLTGLTKIKSRFQAISLLTNSGFTTSEAEIITTNATRRKIAIASMLTGYIFSVVIVSLIFNLINSFSTGLKTNYITVVVAFAVFVFLIVFFKLPFIKKPIEKIIVALAKKIMAKNSADNLITLLDVYGKDAIAEITLTYLPEAFKDKQLCEINTRDTYNINFLVLKRNDIPQIITKETMLKPNDTVIVFGPLQNIKILFLINNKNAK